MSRAARAALYRDAAKLIEERREDRSCCAVAFLDVGNRDEYEISTEAIAYREFMLDGCWVTSNLPWKDDGQDKYFFYMSEEAMEIRVLLLCFMASAVETGDA